jgi:hypothetical protein
MTTLLRQEPVVALTDYDLDGAGASILLDYAFNVVGRKQQGYSKLQRNLEAIRTEYATINTLVVADICMPPETLQWAVEHFDHVVYFDHHEQSELFLPLAEASPEKFTIHWTKDLCSCALVYRAYVMNGGKQTPELDALVQHVNAYDLWHKDSDDFDNGVKMNDLFWELHMQNFRERFKTGFNGFTEMEAKQTAAKHNLRIEIVNRALTEKTASGSTIVMIDNPEAINFVATHLEGDIFYVLYPNQGTGKVHLSARCKDKMPAINLDMAFQELAGERFMDGLITAGGGHANAIGVQFADGVTPNQMADWIHTSLDPRVRNF